MNVKYLSILCKVINIFSTDLVGERRAGINTSVMDDVATVFKGKSLSQLSILEKSIMDKVKGGEGVDVGELYCTQESFI